MSVKQQPILTPVLLDESMASYKAVKRLRQNLDDEGIHNVGLTGPYGSGKSSVIKTLIKEDNNQHHFLELSSATLDDKAAEMGEKKIETNLLKRNRKFMNAGELKEFMLNMSKELQVLLDENIHLKQFNREDYEGKEFSFWLVFS